jgi:hypothetical protein
MICPMESRMIEYKEGSDGAIALTRTVATQASPRARAGLGHAVSIDYRGTLRPTFTCRTLKPPHMRGHREWLKLEGRG